MEKAQRFLSKRPNVIFASSGRGLGMERMMVSLHKDYSDYSEFIRQARTEWDGMVKLESFVISLEVDAMPRLFFLRDLGEYIEKMV
jgi:hypothetical protein